MGAGGAPGPRLGEAAAQGDRTKILRYSTKKYYVSTKHVVFELELSSRSVYILIG